MELVRSSETSVTLLIVDRVAHPTIFQHLLYVYSPDFQVKFSSVHLSVLISSCRMARRKIMLNTKEMFLLGKNPHGKNCCFLLFRKSGIRCLKNLTRLPSGRGEAEGELEPKLDPFVRYGETPTERIVCAIRMHQLRITQRSIIAVIAGKSLGAGISRRIVFSLRYKCNAWVWPKEGPLLQDHKPRTAGKPRWSVLSVL
jgi:hypothetical protein